MIDTEGIIQGEWKSANNSIELSLPLIVFQEDNTFITYCPAFDLSGYGNTEHEAYESFNIVLGEYFLYTTRKKTLGEDLRKHGWIVSNNKTKPMMPPELSKLLETNKDFNRIFNNFPFKKIDQRVSMPTC